MRIGKIFCLLATLTISPLFASQTKELKFDKDWSFYGEQEVEAYRQQLELKKKKGVIFSLQQAKKSIINGDIKLAKFFLSKVNENKTKLGLVKKRYESIIAFIEGRHQDSLDLIASEKFNDLKNYQEICLLRVINLIALDNVKKLKNEVASCQNLTLEYGNAEQFWLKQMTRIKEKNEELLKGNLIESQRNVFANTDFTETWMKMALYLNKEEVILKYIGDLPPEAYRSQNIRELIGFAHYRLGNNKRALEFIEDINSPNADNIRGNINLLEKKYELAFGHFKLALQKKENSQNALKRAIPLAFLLNLWDEGLSMLKRLVGQDISTRRKLILETLFFVKKEDFKSAKENLLYMEKLYNKDFPRDINQMNSYVSLLLADNQRLEKSSAKSCRYYDGLNCWLYLQVLQWENIGLTIQRDDPTLVLEDFSVEAYKNKAEIAPLKESVIIDQRDIEELDNQLVRIDPTSKSK